MAWWLPADETGMNLAHALQSYGYPAVFFGVMLEGESVLLAAAYALHRNFLQWPGVIAMAKLGAMLIDHVYYGLGRQRGIEWLSKHPRTYARAQRMKTRIAQHQILIMLSLRFLIGLRTLTPIMLGMARVPPGRFFICNLISALLWATTVTWLGTRLLHGMRQWIGHLRPLDYWILGGLLLLGVVVALLRGWWLRRSS